MAFFACGSVVAISLYSFVGAACRTDEGAKTIFRWGAAVPGTSGERPDYDYADGVTLEAYELADDADIGPGTNL